MKMELKLENSDFSWQYGLDLRVEMFSYTKLRGTSSLFTFVSVGTSSLVREDDASSEYSPVS